MKDTLRSEMRDAMRAKDQVKIDTIRAILSAIQYEEMQKGVSSLPNETILNVLKSEVKKRKEELEFTQRSSRTDLRDKVNYEIKIIEAFLPAQLDEAGLTKILDDLKSKDPSLNMGSAMKILKDSYPGQYDGRLASEVAKKVFG